MTHRIYFRISALLIAGLFIFTAASCNKKQKNFDNAVLVRVNGEELKAREFSKQLAEKLRGFDAPTVKDSKIVDKMKNEVTHRFIVKVITLKWAEEKNLFVKKEELEAEVNSTRSFYPDDLAFRRALSNEQLTFGEWRNRLKYSLLERKVLESLSGRVQVPTEEELKAYYKNNRDEYRKPEQIKLSQILLSTENDAKRIRAELRKRGKKFGTLARKFSIAPEAQKAGLIGWIEKGTLGVFDKAFSLRAGQVSQVLKSPYGYHILKVLGKRGSRLLKYDSARRDILRKQMAKREQAAYSAWLENQIRQSKVFKNEALIKSLSVETRSE